MFLDVAIERCENEKVRTSPRVKCQEKIWGKPNSQTFICGIDAVISLALYAYTKLNFMSMGFRQSTLVDGVLRL